MLYEVITASVAAAPRLGDDAVQHVDVAHEPGHVEVGGLLVDLSRGARLLDASTKEIVNTAKRTGAEVRGLV